MLRRVMTVRSKNIFFALAILLTVLGCERESSLDQSFDNFFVKYFGADGNQQGVDVVVNSDGTMMLLGNSEDNLSGKQYFLVKVNPMGAVLWQKTYGDISEETAVDIEPTLDGNFIVALQKRRGQDSVVIELVKVSGNGDVLNTSIFGLNSVDKVRSITPVSDGGFLVTGTSADTENPIVTNVFYFRCDANLVFDEINWKKDYGIGDLDEGVKMYESNGSFNLFMSTNSFGLGDSDFNYHFIGVDNFGNPTAGANIFPANNSDDEKLSSVAFDPLTGYALLGTSQSGSDGSKSIFLVLFGTLLYPTPQVLEVIPINQGREKLDLEGNFSGISICKAASGGYIILANEEITVGSSTNNNIVLVRVDAQGRYRWHRSFGAEFNDRSSTVAELPDGKIIVIGTIRLDSQDKMALIKVNSEGQFLE
jgi:hypothetical protein